MAYVNKIIGKEETLIGIARLHWIYVARGVIWFAAMAAIGVAFSNIFERVLVMMSQYVNASAIAYVLLKLQSYSMMFFVAMGAFMFLSYLMKFLVTEIALTSRRVLHKEGFIFVKVRHIDLEEIRGENLDVGMFGRFLNYAYLLLDCRFLGDVRLPAIARAETFLKALHYHRSHTQDAVSVVVGKGNAAPLKIVTPQADVPSGPSVQINQESPVAVSSVAPEDVPHIPPQPAEAPPQVQVNAAEPVQPEKTPVPPQTPPAPPVPPVPEKVPVTPPDQPAQPQPEIVPDNPNIPPQPEITPQREVPPSQPAEIQPDITPQKPEIQQPPMAQTSQAEIVAQAVAQAVEQVVPKLVKEMTEQGVIQPQAAAPQPQAQPEAQAEEELLNAFDDVAFQTKAKSVAENGKDKPSIH